MVHFVYAILLFCLPDMGPDAKTEQPLYLVGTWKGVLTQNQGGFTPEYNFELQLEIKEGKIVGTSYVSVQNIYAQWSLSGSLQGDTFYFEETQLGDHTKNKDLYWCLKKGNLRLMMHDLRWVLYGNWEGESSLGPCVPGKIRLEKVIPQV
ncbi:MAG: hypothetical protein HRU40_01735 [Saprospiraceae bacterium]|nr:hypothetical protein [Saprospiraceae bacterium]